MRDIPWIRCAATIAVFAASPARVRAQAPFTRPTLTDVVSYALRENPDLITARLRVDSARAEQRIARSVPNPTFSTIPGNPFQYSVNEPIDIGPNRLYRNRAARQGTTAARLDTDDARRQVVFSLRQAFFDLLLAEAIRDVSRQQRDITRRLLAADSLRLRSGDIAKRDVSTTELQLAHSDATFARAEAGARAARMNLQVLMGVPRPDTGFRVNGSLDYRPATLPFDSLQELAVARRSDIAAAAVRIEQSRALRSLASANLIPVPGANVVYQAGQPFASGSNYALGLSFSLPVFYWFSGERQRANAGLQSAVVARDRTVVQTRADVATAAANYLAARELAKRYASGLLAKAQASLDMQRFAYEHGNASLLDLLNAINAFGDTQTDYFISLHDYWVAIYAIDRAVGSDVVP